MKKMFAAVIVFGLAVSLFSNADAGYRNGMGGGCGNCGQAGAPSDPQRKFHSDTIDLRQDMMLKRFEIQRENLKGTPDTAKIANLQAEIKTIQSQISTIRTQSGLPQDKCDGECDQSVSGCGKKNMVDCGKGMGGCNNGPCGSRK